MITKQEWQRAYDVLNELHGLFYLRYNIYLKGKNKSIQAEAEVDVRDIISKASKILLRDIGMFNLLEGSENIEGYAGAMALESFESLNGFDSEIGLLLLKIQLKIRSFE